MAVGCIEGQGSGVDGAPLQGGVYDVGQHPGLAHQDSAAHGLAAPLLGKGHVDPTGEEVLGVPLTLTVAEQDQGVRHSPPPLASSPAQ